MHTYDNGQGNLPPTAMSELETLALERQARDRTVLELGAEYGYSTIVMARVAKLVVSVDWHRGYTRASIGGQQDTVFQYLYNVKDVREKVVPIIGRFQEVLPVLRDASFDFVFIDGGHEWESTIFSFVEANRLVKPEGNVACHDYGHPLCSERAIAESLGWWPSNPVIGTFAIFPPGQRGGGTGTLDMMTVPDNGFRMAPNAPQVVEGV